MKQINRWKRIKNFPSYLFLFLVILVVPFVYSTSVLDPSLYPRLFALNLTIAGFGLLLVTLAVKNGDLYDSGIFRKNIFRFYLGYIIISVISIFFALNISEAIFEWFKIFTFFTTFCLLTVYLSSIKNSSEIITRTVVVFSLIISLYGFYEIYTVTSTLGLNHQTTYSIRALSSNRNLYSQLLLITLPFTFYGIYLFRSLWRVMAIISSVFVLILITVLLTRSVWVAAVFSLFIALIVLLLYRKYFLFDKRMVRVLSISLIVAIVVILTGISIYKKYGNVKVFEKQFYWVSNYQFGSTLERVELWKMTLEMGVDNPVTGVGPGNWRFVIPEYGSGELRNVSGETFFQRPHNDFLWVMAETGIAGFIFYLLIFISAFYYLFKIIKSSGKVKERYFALSLIFGLTGYIIISLVSFPKERIEHQIFLSLMLAATVVKYNSLFPSEKQAFNISLVSIPVILLLMFGTFISQSRMVSGKHIRKALDFRTEQKWQNVISEIQKAKSQFTTVDAFSTPLCWYGGEAYFRLNNVDSAYFCFDKAYLVNPNHLHVLNNLGTTLELKKEHNKAKACFAKAIKLSPHFEDALLNLSAVYYNEKETDSAYLTIARISDTTNDVRYDKFLTAILWKKINEFSNEIDDRQLRNSIIRIRNDNAWMKKVFLKSKKKQNDIERQLLIEAVYLMESVDSTITDKEAEKLKIKYHLQE